MTAILAGPALRTNAPAIHSPAASGQPGHVRQSIPSDHFFDLQEGIRFAMSWTELEGWIDRAGRAYARGDLDAVQVEELAEQAVRVSQQVPENWAWFKAG
jgi:hypothetical protein